MNTFDRRQFMVTVSCSLAGVASASRLPLAQASAESADLFHQSTDNRDCWLDVVAPFIIEDDGLGIGSEIVLTSDTFAGAAGHADGKDATDYEIYLYDAAGKAVGAEGVARRLTVKAMNTTVIPVRDLIGAEKKFCGGMKIRLRPNAREKMAASDLFSSAFVRWRSADSFDNIHANPDLPQWQTTDSYFYAMPFPSLAEYECVFSLFNPNDERSAGELAMNDARGKRLAALRYELKPHASLFFNLNAGSVTGEPWPAAASTAAHRCAGLLSVANEQGTAKSFGFLMIRRPAQKRFSIEHPIHQGVFKPKPAPAPFDDRNQFSARNALYSPLVFCRKRVGGLTLDSRFQFGAGLPLEEAQWFYPLIVDGAGDAVWSAMKDAKLAASLPGQTERGVIRLGANQSCQLDFSQLSLDRKISADFSGGLCVAVAPDISHVMLKAEVRVAEWGAYAFTHFRPGLRAARAYQKAKPRGGLATDYIVSGARLARGQRAVERDELIGVINIDDQGLEARPTLEVFGARGLAAKRALGVIAPFACRHFLLSDLLPKLPTEAITLRLMDEHATLLMSALHIDYARRDIALDHGSDRFSTFLDAGCR